MVGLSRLAGGGLVLVLALLPLTLDGKPAAPPQALHKASLTALPALRIMWDLRPDSKQSQAAWHRLVHPEPHTGGGGDSRPLQEQHNKGQDSGSFGRRIDRIDTPPPAPLTVLAALQILGYLHPASKHSRAARDQMVHPKPHVEGGSGGDSRPLLELANKGPPDGCFGFKLDRIGTMSGLGCNGGSKPVPKPTPGHYL